MGSTTFFVTGFVVCAGYLGLGAPSGVEAIAAADVLGTSLIAALAGTAIEAVSPSAYDDLTVPVGAAVVLLLATL